jgi:hypothetical protein
MAKEAAETEGNGSKAEAATNKAKKHEKKQGGG